MRKSNTETNRKKAAFTVIDALGWIIILATVWVIGTNILHALPLTPTTNGDVKMTYVLTVTDLPEDILTQIKTDQIIYDRDTGEMIGTVSSIVQTPYIVKGINQSTGELISNTVEGRYNINITVSAEAKEVDNSYRINGVTVACGLSYRFRTSTVALDGTCVSLKNQ